MPDLFITKVGDTARSLYLNLGMDLTGCTVAIVGTLNGRTKIDSADAVVLAVGDDIGDGGTAEEGDIRYDPTSGDVDTAGMMSITAVITLPSEEEISVPASADPDEAYFWWRIDPR